MKAKLHHPQVLAVKVWAFGHLLATGMLHDVVLFGAFLLWAIVLFAVLRRRDRVDGTVYPAGSVGVTCSPWSSASWSGPSLRYGCICG